jgi:hypothetical protein
MLARDAAVTLPRVRDELHTSRKLAQGFLEYFDRERFTRQLPDDRGVRRRQPEKDNRAGPAGAPAIAPR